MKIKTLTIILSSLIALSSSALAENIEYDINYQKGVISKQHNHYDDAIFEFEKIITKHSKNRAFATLLADTYQQNGIKNFNNKNYKKASNDFRLAIFYLKYFLTPTAIEIEKASEIAPQLDESIKREGGSITCQTRFNIGRNLEKKYLFKQAIVEYLTSAQDTTLSKVAFQNAGDLFKELKLFENASQYYKKALKIDPIDYNLHFKNAKILEQLGDSVAALNEYKLSIEDDNIPFEVSSSIERLAFLNLSKYPQNPTSYIEVGDVYKSKNDFTQAFEYYEKAKKLAPNNIQIKLKTAEIYSAQNQTTKALELYNEILKTQPSQINVYINRAKLYKEQNKYQEAINDYKKALFLDKNNLILIEEVLDFLVEVELPNKLKIYEEIKNHLNNEKVQIAYANELFNAKAYSQALLEYQKIIDKNKGNIQCYIQKSKCYEALFDFSKAIQSIDTGLINNPMDKRLPAIKVELLQKKNEILYNKATNFLEKSAYLDALKIYLQIEEPSKDVFVKIGECYHKTNNLQKAYEYYEKAFLNDCNYIPCIKNLCEMYQSQSKFGQALEMAQKGNSLEPDNLYFKNKLTEIKKLYHEHLLKLAIECYEKMNYKKALKNLNDVLALNPKNSYGYYYKGLCYDALNDSLSAIENYEKILTIDPPDEKLLPTIYYSLGIDYDTIAEYNKAKEAYKKFIALSGTTDNEFSKYAKKRLREISSTPKPQKQ